MRHTEILTVSTLTLGFSTPYSSRTPYLPKRHATGESMLITMVQRANLLGVALLTFVTLVAAIDKTKSPELIARLTTAATQLDRQALLGSDKDWLFDFSEQQPFYNFSPGGVINMNAATFPAARGNGMTRQLLLVCAPASDSQC